MNSKPTDFPFDYFYMESFHKILVMSTPEVYLEYSSVPKTRVRQSKRAGGKILKKTLNVQDKY